MADLKISNEVTSIAPNKKRSLEELLSTADVQPELSKIERRKLKKQRKKVLSGKGTREDFYDIYGNNARAEVTLKLGEYLQRNRTKLKFTDIQSLILWVLGEAVSPRWAFISNKPLIEKVLVVVVDGLIQGTLKSHAAHLPCLTGESVALKRKLQPIPLEIPSSLYSPTAVLKALLACPLSRMNGVRKDKSAGNQSVDDEEEGPTHSKPSPFLYTMSWSEMKANGFPLPAADGTLEPGFVCTKSFRSPSVTTSTSAVSVSLSSSSSGLTTTSSSASLTVSSSASDDDEGDEGEEEDTIDRKLFAIDCEMCYTEKGLELARISLIDHLHRPLYDSLVKPHNPITDYNTRFSGLTAENMKDVTTTIEDVQQKILEVISSDDFICGHSLENDLKAMKIIHKRVIDTSLLYPHPKGPPYKLALRHLTKRWLGREIQTCQVGGHDSVEDAKAALELVQLKLKNGPQWGVESNRADNFMSVLSRYRRAIDVCACADYLTDPSLFPPIVSAHQGATDAVRIDSAIQAMKKKNDLVIVCLHEMMIALNREEPPVEEKVAPVVEETTSKRSKKQKRKLSSSLSTPSVPSSSAPLPTSAVANTNADLERLLAACALNTMVIVVSGQTAAGSIRRMQLRKVKALQKTAKETWTVADDTALNILLEEQLDGVAFVAIK